VDCIGSSVRVWLREREQDDDDDGIWVREYRYWWVDQNENKSYIMLVLDHRVLLTEIIFHADFLVWSQDRSLDGGGGDGYTDDIIYALVFCILCRYPGTIDQTLQNDSKTLMTYWIARWCLFIYLRQSAIACWIVNCGDRLRSFWAFAIERMRGCESRDLVIS